MDRQWPINGLAAVALGVVTITVCALIVRNERVMRSFTEVVLRTYRLPVTAEMVERGEPWLKAPFVTGIVVGTLLLLIGIVILIRGA